MRPVTLGGTTYLCRKAKRRLPAEFGPSRRPSEPLFAVASVTLRGSSAVRGSRPPHSAADRPRLAGAAFQGGGAAALQSRPQTLGLREELAWTTGEWVREVPAGRAERSERRTTAPSMQSGGAGSGRGAFREL